MQSAIAAIESVSPACAGMIPIDTALNDRKISEPRMRGDDPSNAQLLDWFEQ